MAQGVARGWATFQAQAGCLPPVAPRKESLLACAFIIVLVLGPAILATRAQGETRAAATTRPTRVPACKNCLRESACESLPEPPAVNSGESREVGATFQVGCLLLVAPRREASKNVHPVICVYFSRVRVLGPVILANRAQREAREAAAQSARLLSSNQPAGACLQVLSARACLCSELACPGRQVKAACLCKESSCARLFTQCT